MTMITEEEMSYYEHNMKIRKKKKRQHLEEKCFAFQILTSYTLRIRETDLTRLQSMSNTAR